MSGRTGGDDAQAFLDQLEHAHNADIPAMRRIVLGADERIAEGVKWNSLSFRTDGDKCEWFATVNLREKQGVGIILHFGAKKNAISETGVAVADPAGLLRWLAKDRAVAVFRDGVELKAKEAALHALLREWITHV